MTELAPRTSLASSGLEVSRIAFGTSHLSHIASERQRRRILDEARDLGITHFDTARLYGDGLSERSLGKALARSRPSVTLATKFGLLARDWIGALGAAGTPFVATRAVLRRAGVITWPRESYAVAAMRSSLERSLRLLRTDHLDVLFVHDPPVDVFDRHPDLYEALVGERERGRIRFLGVAGVNAVPIAAAHPEPFDVVQAPEDSWGGTGVVPDLTYGALSAPGGGPLRDRLTRALTRRPHGAVIVRTGQVAHLREIVGIADSTEP